MFDILGAVEAGSNLINGLLDRTWPNPSEEDKAKIERLKIDIKRDLEIVRTQTDINKQEAKHPSLLVAGWRPFVGWVCGIALLYVSLLEPILRFLVVTFGDSSTTFPIIDTEITFQVLMGMLGLTAVRGYEKVKGVARETLG